MGVKDLWSILAPVKVHVKLEELKGQTLAVDLSIWICEVKSMKQLQGVVKPHLRNLFFRICHLLQLGIKLVFVVEGTPPAIKWDTICKRLDAGTNTGRFYNHGNKTRCPSRKMSRSHFKSIINECCVMLDYLGVPHVQSEGEAEAMCALLNANKIVDACITNDGDAFLYGASVIYRNFTINTKDPHVESYSLADIESQLKLNREKLVGLGLLLGCDYVPAGVPGVGRETAMKFMATLPDEYPILSRFEEWSHPGKSQSVNSVGMPPHCSVCGHLGSADDHGFSGCMSCDLMICKYGNKLTPCSCEWHRSIQKMAETERVIQKKAVVVKGFPRKEVINEFLTPRDKLPRCKIEWKRPRMFALQKFHTEKLEWPEEYSMEKILPLLTLFDMNEISKRGISKTKEHLQPHSIVKARVRQGVPCYEINWHKLGLDDVYTKDYYTTIEERQVFSKCFPEVVSKFEETQAKPKKTATKKSKQPKVKEPDAVSNDQESTNSTDQSQSSTSSANQLSAPDVSWFTCSPSRLTAFIPFSDKTRVSAKPSTKSCTHVQAKSAPSIVISDDSNDCMEKASDHLDAEGTSRSIKLISRENLLDDDTNHVYPNRLADKGAAADARECHYGNSAGHQSSMMSIQESQTVHWFSTSPRGVSGFITAEGLVRPKQTRPRLNSKKTKSKLARRAKAVLCDVESPFDIKPSLDVKRKARPPVKDVKELTDIVSKLNLNPEDDELISQRAGCDGSVSALSCKINAEMKDRTPDRKPSKFSTTNLELGKIIDQNQNESKENVDPCQNNCLKCSPFNHTWNRSEFGCFQINSSLLSNSSQVQSPEILSQSRTSQIKHGEKCFIPCVNSLKTAMHSPKSDKISSSLTFPDTIIPGVMESIQTSASGICAVSANKSADSAYSDSDEDDLPVLSQIPLAERLAMRGSVFTNALSSNLQSSSAWTEAGQQSTDSSDDSVIVIE